MLIVRITVHRQHLAAMEYTATHMTISELRVTSMHFTHSTNAIITNEYDDDDDDVL